MRDPALASQHFLKSEELFSSRPHSTNEELAAQAAGEANIEAKLVILAWDRKRRPEMYRVIEKGYVDLEEYRRRYPTKRATLADFPRTEHVTEEYRLPWEYFLIRPRLENSVSLYDYRAADALARIRNDKSLVSLMYQFQLNSHPKTISTFTQERQRRALEAISEFRNQRALDALLRCISVAENQAKRRDGVGPEWDVEKWVFERLTSREEPEFHENWNRVLEGYSVKVPNLPPKQHQLIERISAAIQAEKKP